MVDSIDSDMNVHTSSSEKVSTSPKVCFVGHHNSRFVRDDIELLGGHYRLNIIQPPSHICGWPHSAINIITGALRSDISFYWFAGWHAAIGIIASRLVGKPSIIVVGGYDAANVPEIDYGAFRRRKERWATCFALRGANLLLVVDASLTPEVIKNAGVSGDRILPLPTGYDPEAWYPAGDKERVVLTVGQLKKDVYIRKGLKSFIDVARMMPDTKFIIVGKPDPEFQRSLEGGLPPNLTVTGFVKDEELLRLYQKAKVYCQLSRFEGLPNALCEAMLCGCIPVGTRYCGIPTAIGDTGYYANYDDADSTLAAIDFALKDPPSKGLEARERIRENFSKYRREEGLRSAIDRLIHHD